MDYLKSVVQPVRQATPLSRIRGWADDYDHITADILVIEGEIHLGRKPGGMRFTSIKARDNFSRMVLYGLRPTERVRDLAAEVHDRMLQKVGGRMWMAGHMRRGDCEWFLDAAPSAFRSLSLLFFTCSRYDRMGHGGHYRSTL